MQNLKFTYSLNKGLVLGFGVFSVCFFKILSLMVAKKRTEVFALASQALEAVEREFVRTIEGIIPFMTVNRTGGR